jgi:hypothetical protein
MLFRQEEDGTAQYVLIGELHPPAEATGLGVAAMNEVGDVVGVASFPDVPYRAVLWEKGKPPIVLDTSDEASWANEYETLDDARRGIGGYVDRYHHRPHSGLNYKAPYEVKETWEDLQNIAA